MSRTTRKVLTVMQKVEILLTKYPKYRDDDKSLIRKMWEVELLKQNLNLNETNINMFLSLYENGTLSNPDSILRARRKLQETNEELRGETWEERHKEAEETRKTIV